MLRPLRSSLVLGLSLALLTGAPVARAAEKAIWGPAVLPDGRSAFPTYDELGVDTLQLTLDWSTIAPTRPADPTNPFDPAYRWPADADAAAREAPGRGIRLALLAIFSPPWANGGRAKQWAPEPSDYANFLTAAARRYSGTRRWMVWSEPNKANNFQPIAAPGGPQLYARILDAAYGALKSVSSQNKVIGGMTWSGGDVLPRPFLNAMKLPNGKRPRLDWFGHNPFPFRFPDLAKSPQSGYRDFSDLDTYQREVRSAFGRTVPFWLSEYTIQSDQGSDTFPTFVSRANQARWLTRAYEIADTKIVTAGLGWLSLIDEPPGKGAEFFGLLTSDLQRKASFAAFRDALAQRFAPTVRVPRSARATTVRGRGLRVRLTPRTAGRIRVRLRRGSSLIASVRTSGARRPTSVRLRSRSRSLRPGSYRVVFTSPRGSTIVRALRLR